MKIHKILLLAGEDSGLIYAERLKDALQAARPDAVIEFRGYQSEGFKTADLAVMGLWLVLKRIFFFLNVARTMKRLIREWRPDVVVGVDYPDLNLKLAAYAKSLGIPAVHIVCPQVWAWRQKRIPKVAAAVTKLLCFLPFEASIFKDYEGRGFSARFIGHPMVDLCAEEERAAGSRRLEGGFPSQRIVALLPGSRMGEIHLILPRLLQSLHALKDFNDFKDLKDPKDPKDPKDLQALKDPKGPKDPKDLKALKDLKVVIPAASEKAYAEIERQVREIPPPASFQLEIVRGKAREVLRQADCAAVASGTATLEAALARCPTIVVYAVAPIVAWFLRRMIKGVRHVGLANVIAEKVGMTPPMPELLQEDFTPEAVAGQLAAWLGDPDARSRAVASIDATLAHLRSDGAAISNAAREILETLDDVCR